MMKSALRFAFFFCVVSFAGVAKGQVPLVLSYQGMLEENGTPVSGQHLITISIYDSVAGGAPSYEESQTVSFLNGIFNMKIGATVPFPPSMTFDRPFYLGLSFEGNQELSPRSPLLAAPYAITSHVAELAEGLTSNARGVVTSINELAGPLRLVGDSTTNIIENGNEITVHANGTGRGLQSVVSPDKTIAIANGNGPIASIGIADSSIATAMLRNGSVTLSKLAPSGAAAGQILKWNGSSWTVGNDSVGASNYVAGQGISIVGNTISAKGGLPDGTLTNSTLRWSGTNWVENVDLTSDASGNTRIDGSSTLGSGNGVDNITMNPGMGQVQVTGWPQGVVVSGPTGVLSVGQLNGGAGISVTRNLNTLTISDTGSIGWALSGNSGTSPLTNFLGTTDDQPFEIHIYNSDGSLHGSHRVLRFEPNLTSANIIGGYQGNAVSSSVVGATVVGGGLNGFNNIVTDDFGFVGGGSLNQAGNNSGSATDASHATVVGGGGNTASGLYSSILGGTGNTANGVGSSVGGGSSNTALGDYSTIGGGVGDSAAGTIGTIAGGGANIASGNYSTVGGGIHNRAAGTFATIAGGDSLTVGTSSFGINVPGRSAQNGILDLSASNNLAYFGNMDVWLGNTDNSARQLRFYPASTSTSYASRPYSSFTAGGQSSTIQYILPVSQPASSQVLTATAITGSGPYSVTLGWTTPSGSGSTGGWNLTGNSGTADGTNFLGTTDNTALTLRVNNLRVLRIQPAAAGTAPASFAAGGLDNTIATGDTASFLGMGEENHIATSDAAIIGGILDTISAAGEASGIFTSYASTISGQVSTISGGENNLITGDASSISGGYSDTIAGAFSGFTGGGSYNEVTDDNGAIAGGELNTAYLNAFIGGGIANSAGTYSHSSSAVIGGAHNTATGDYSTITGGEYNSIPLSALNSSVLGGTGNYAGGSNSALIGGGHLRMTGDNAFGFHAGSGASDSAYITTSNTAYFGNVNLWLGNTNNSASQLRFYSAQNGGISFPSPSTHYTALAAAGQTADISYTLPSTAPSSNGNLLLASTASPSVMAWSSGLVWDNTNDRLGINTTSPSHALHSVYSGTSDETAAIFGNATGSTTNQSIGVWGKASNTTTTNTGTIGVLAAGNGNTTAGNTNVALQVNDGEFTMGRTTESPSVGSDVEAAAGGTAYTQQGPSGMIELTLGGGNLSTSAPTAGSIQDLGSVTINNRYCETGSIVLTNVVAMIDDGTAPNPQNAAWIVNADNTSSGSFVVRIKMIPTATSASNYSTSDKIRIGYMIVNKSK